MIQDEKLIKKQRQIQDDLDSWAVENLSPNQQLRCTLEIIDLPKVIVIIDKSKSEDSILSMSLKEFFTLERLESIGASWRFINNIWCIQGKTAHLGPKNEIVINTIKDLLKCPRNELYISWVGKKSYDIMERVLAQVGIIWH